MADCEPVASGQRVILRAGEGAPVFLLAGGGGDTRELDLLASLLRTPRPIVALCFWQGAADHPPPGTVEEMAEHALVAMRIMQANGPYLLVGYSLGGLVAHEIMRRLIATGEPVQTPILIDAIPHRASWPPDVFAAAAFRRLALNTTSRRTKGGAQSPTRKNQLDRLRAALRHYRPGRHDRRVILLHAIDNPVLGAMAPKLWRRFAGKVDAVPLPGGHLDLLREAGTARVIARFIDAAAGLVDPPAERPSALILTALSWVTTARLAVELDRAGFAVSAVAPRRHPLAGLECVRDFHRYRPLDAVRSISAAIDRVRPDILVAADDHVVALLHRLHATAAPDAPLRALIARSLGDPASYPLLYDRTRMAAMARDLQITTPETIAISTPDSLARALSVIGFPAFIKIDGSWGGLGVAEVTTLADAMRVRRCFSTTPNIARAAKRLLVNGDATLGGGRRARAPALSLQAAIAGDKAIAWAVCRDGEVLAVTVATVLSSRGSTGPATAIRPADHPEITQAIRKIAAHLCLSGLCGFDFVIRHDDKRAYFIELNPRATPTAHLFVDGTPDPFAIFVASFGGDARARHSLPSGIEQVALCPARSEIRAAACDGPIHHDLPWHSPALIASARPGRG